MFNRIVFRFINAIAILLVVLALCMPSFSNAEKVPSTKNQKVLYSLDFSEAKDVTNIKSWLTNKGFQFKKDPSEMKIYYKDGGLVFDSTSTLFFFALNENLNLKDSKEIKITWGVDKFPSGASYAKKVRNEAFMIYLYYGRKFLDSGSMFIPNAPYFLGLYLSDTDTSGEYYIGWHFKDGGRYVCVGNPKIGETVTTKFNLEKGFKKAFGEEKNVPEISGIALEAETDSTGPGKAFIKKLEILGG